MGNTISETRKEQLKELQNQLNNLNDSIQKIIDGKSSMYDFARQFGITQQGLNNSVNNGLYSVLRKIKILDNSDVKRLLIESMSPAEKLINKVLCAKEPVILDIDEQDKVHEMLKIALKEKEYNVIVHRYGFNGNDVKTQSECAKLLKLSQMRIKQIEDRALIKLRYKDYIGMLLPNYDLRIKAIKENPYMIHVNELLIKREKTAKDVALINITDLHLSSRSYSCLRNNNITTVGELSKLTIKKLLQISNMGPKSVEEIINKLKPLGIVLKER